MGTLLTGLDWSIFFQPAFDGSGTYLRFLLVGLEWTLLLSITAWILAFVVGSIVGVLRTLPGKLLPGLGAAYVAQNLLFQGLRVGKLTLFPQAAQELHADTTRRFTRK